MKSIKNISILCMALNLVSCTYHFELDEISAKEKLVLYSFPGSADTTLIHLSRSIPVQGKGELIKGVRDANVRFLVNGKNQKVIWSEDSTASVPAQCYYVEGGWNPKDQIDIYASVDKLPTVSSHTTVTNEFPLDKIEFKHKAGEKGKLQFQVTFRDDPQAQNYYGMRIERKQMYWTDGEYSDSRHGLELEIDDEPLLNEISGLDNVFMFSNDFFQNLYIWNDAKIQGRTYTLRLNTNYSADYEEDSWDSHHIIFKAKYRISLYALSEEFYRYIKNLNDIKNNQLGGSGLSPIRPTYTNVQNGIGVVGGCRLTQTQWMDNI